MAVSRLEVGRIPTREVVDADAIDGVRPACVVTPGSADDVTEVLLAAATAGAPVVLRGGGTKLGWGRPPAAVGALVDLSAINTIVHDYGDLTATIGAGATLAEVNRVLAQHGQWLPVDVGFDRATVGGTLAAADSGPLRHRFGTLRDQVLGVTLATVRGDLVRAGGRVVKNVAGYDLGRLMSGSHGAYAAVVSATFKVVPLVPASASVVATFTSIHALAEAAESITRSQLEPIAFDVRAPFGGGHPQPASLVLRFASTARAVEAACAHVRPLLAAGSVTRLDAGDQDACWREQTHGPWDGEGTVVRLSWQPTYLGSLLERLGALGVGGDLRGNLVGRVALGTGLLRLDGSLDARTHVIEQLRAAGPGLGTVAILRGDRDLKSRVDVWGDPGPSASVARLLKTAFDPAGVLNAGRGPV